MGKFEDEVNKAYQESIMENLLKKKITRFRAFQLGNAGSSFSYFDGTHFTLIEARLTDTNRPRIKEELKACGVNTISCLHITSWDADHCASADLEEILQLWTPAKIEHPGYNPHTDTGKECLKIITEYKKKPKKEVVKVDPPYIKSLNPSSKWGYRNILYWPKQIDAENANNNSTVKFFRTGSFNILSLGDLEDPEIASYLKKRNTLQDETDIMILAHHGADNGFTTKSLLKLIKPRVTICSSNYDNQFAHPKEEIRKLLHEQEILVFTTKTGDVIVESVAPHKSRYAVWNLISDSTKVSSKKEFKSRKSHYLGNPNRAKNHYEGTRNSFKKFY